MKRLCVALAAVLAVSLVSVASASAWSARLALIPATKTVTLRLVSFG